MVPQNFLDYNYSPTQISSDNQICLLNTFSEEPFIFLNTKNFEIEAI